MKKLFVSLQTIKTRPEKAFIRCLVWPLEVYVGRHNSLVCIDLVRFAGSIVHLVEAIGDDLNQTAVRLPAQLTFLAQSHPDDVFVGWIHSITGHAVEEEKSSE